MTRSRKSRPAWHRLAAYACISSAIVAAILLVAPGGASGYNPFTHRNLVVDAIDYIEASGTPAQRQALARLMAAAGGSSRLRLELPKAAHDADFYQDLALFSNSVFVTLYSWDSHYFTRLSHFVNTRRPGQLWQGFDGYNYEGSSRVDEDHLAMAGDDVSDFNMEVDNEYSPAVERYRTHFQGSNDAWNRNWTFDWDWDDDWDIANTRFPPASAMAYYWYRRYVNFMAEPATVGLAQPIGGIKLLGAPLHAAGDVTVPHHAFGALALSHAGYENEAEAWHDAGVIRRKDALISSHLRDRPFLRYGLETVPPEVKTLQVTIVTSKLPNAGTDATVRLDLGTGKSWDLDTPMEDRDPGGDDTYTLDARGLRVQDFRQIKIRVSGAQDPWHMKAIYVVVNGVLLYGNSAVNTWLGPGQEWKAQDFTPRTTLTKRVWPIDRVINEAAAYTADYFRRTSGAADPTSPDFWDKTYFSAANERKRIEIAEHLLNLGIALVVRVIEQSQQELEGGSPIILASMMPGTIQTPANLPQPPQGASGQPVPRHAGRVLEIVRARRAQGAPSLTRDLEHVEDSLAGVLPSAPTRPTRSAQLPGRERKPAANRPAPKSMAAGGSGFRLPSQAELRDPQRLEQYHRAAREAEISKRLTNVTLTRAALKARLRAKPGPAERARLESQLTRLERVRSALVKR